MTGLSEAEGRVIHHLVEAWNAYVELPVPHQDATDEFRHGIHALQHMVFARPAIRAWNADAPTPPPAGCDCSRWGYTGCGICDACKSTRPSAVHRARQTQRSAPRAPAPAPSGEPLVFGVTFASGDAGPC